MRRFVTSRTERLGKRLDSYPGMVYNRPFRLRSKIFSFKAEVLMQNTFFLVLLVVAVLALVGGCAAIERALTPDPVTGDSPAVSGAKQVAPIADSFVPGLGEALLGAAMLAQNIFLLIKKKKAAKAKA
jgi:hypothetical protein